MCDFVVAFSEDLDRLEHDAGAFQCWHCRPNGVTGLRGSYGSVDVTLACLLHFADHLVRGGVDGLKGFTGRRVDVLAADVQLLRRKRGGGM